MARNVVTLEEKLIALRKAWGYVEVSASTIISSWRIWLVKNYSGKSISDMDGQSLPGHPRAREKIEHSGSSMSSAIGTAYYSMMNKAKRRGRKKNAG